MAPDSTARHRMHALEALYPYQFAGPHLGLNVSNGWIAIFEKLCADVDAILGEDKQGFYWKQCKEKFGKARFYYETASAKPRIRIDAFAPNGKVVSVRGIPTEEEPGADEIKLLDKLVSEAEQQTGRLCYVCGAEAALDASNGWVLTLCSQHSQKMAKSRDAFIDELNALNGHAA